MTLFALFLWFKAGISFMLSLSLALLSAEKNKWGNIYLSLCFLGYTLFALDDGLGTLRYLDNPSDYWQVLNFPIFLTPLWIYLAIHHYSNQKTYPSGRVIALLLIPFLFRVLTWDVIDGFPVFHLPMTLVEDTVLLLFLLIVAILSFGQLSLHTSYLQGFYSDLRPVNLSWLFRFLVGFILIRSMSLLISSFKSILGLVAFADFADFLILLYLAYHSISQKEIFPTEVQSLLPSKESSIKRQTRRQKDVELQETKAHVLGIMEKQKPYLNPELTLPELAQLSSMKTNELSHFLNDCLDENFYGLVNRYRVEESKRLLSDPNYQHLSILGIAMEAGFNSKTAFNTNFKRITQQTPSAYRKMYQP
ncbi:MAG: helix-turn-helix domain-containing protein [Saprospiraceae bacterium]|nr:helix-turn-helix domain-containing protein [Saprospiraceae bacterium]